MYTIVTTLNFARREKKRNEKSFILIFSFNIHCMIYFRSKYRRIKLFMWKKREKYFQ